jgi:hypothetical protein
MKLSGQLHATAAIFPVGKNPLYPLDTMAPVAGLNAVKKREVLALVVN